MTRHRKQLLFTRSVNRLKQVISSMSGLVVYWPLNDQAGTKAGAFGPITLIGRNVVVNGSFATNTVWTKNGGWTISGGVAVASAESNTLTQTLTTSLTLGKTYRLTYTISGYVSGSVRGEVGSGGVGTFRAANGTYVEDIVCTTDLVLRMRGNSFTGNIDDVTCQELNIAASTGAITDAMAATINTGTVVNYLAGKIGRAFKFVASNVNIFSNTLNGAMNMDEGSIIVFAQVDSAAVWTDATNRYLLGIQVDSNNRFIIRKSSTNNTLEVFYFVGSVSKSVSVAAQSMLGFFQIGMSWSKAADQLKMYINGVQVGATVTGLGTWVGNLSSTACTIGASDTSNASPWSGLIAHVPIFNRPLTAAEFADIARAGGCA